MDQESIHPNAESSETRERHDFNKQVVERGVATEVIPGLSITSENYKINSDNLFTWQNSIDTFTRFLATPTIVDTFSDHEERKKAYKTSGLFYDFGTDFFMENKLRLNRLSGAHGWLKVFSDSSFRKETENDAFCDFASNTFKNLEGLFDNYQSGTNQDRLDVVNTLTNAVIEVLNKAVSEGLIDGPVIEK